MRNRLAPSRGKTVLLTLGRLPVALDIARSFRQAGWRVLVAEPTRMHLARMSAAVARCFTVTAPVRDAEAYRADLADIVAAEHVDLVVPVSEESMYVAALKDRLPATVELFCMPQPDMLVLHDKLRFARTAEQFGLCVPQTAQAGSAEGEALARQGAYVAKPRYSCSGRGIVFHEAGEPAEYGPEMLVQARLDGQPYSSFSIAHDGRVLASAVYRGTIMDGSVAVGFERVTDMPALETWTATFVRRAGHTGFIAFDFIVDDGGRVTALECNPRATSGIHFIEADAVAAAILGASPPGPVHRPERLLAESYSCFTATLGSLRSPDLRRHNWRQLRRARDVTWARQDPWPFLLMTINTYRILALSMFKGHSFAAAAVLDIEWHDVERG